MLAKSKQVAAALFSVVNIRRLIYVLALGLAVLTYDWFHFTFVRWTPHFPLVVRILPYTFLCATVLSACFLALEEARQYHASVRYITRYNHAINYWGTTLGIALLLSTVHFVLLYPLQGQHLPTWLSLYGIFVGSSFYIPLVGVIRGYKMIQLWIHSP